MSLPSIDFKYRELDVPRQEAREALVAVYDRVASGSNPSSAHIQPAL